jgi:hypothetical protein
MKPTEQQNAELRAYLDERFKPQWAEAIYKEMEGMDVDNRGDHPIWQRDYQDHRWCDNDIFWGIAASPESAIKFIRAYDPDFAAKVLMPPELEWKIDKEFKSTCEIFGYELKAYYENHPDLDWDGFLAPAGFFSIKKDGTLITEQSGEEVGEESPYLLAEIAFLRHYMKLLV